MMRFFRILFPIAVLSFGLAITVPAQEDDENAPEEDTCKEDFWTLKGGIRKDVEKFDKFIKGVAASKDKVTELNAYLKRDGLPQQLALNAGEKIAYPNRVEGGEDSPGGPMAILFLRKLETKKSGGLALDHVYEVENPNAKTEIAKWNVPFEFPGVEAAEGDEIFYEDTLNAICGDGTLKIDFGIKPGGEFRALELKDTPKVTKLSSDKCKAGSHLFPGSAYSFCVEIQDLKTKKKRYFIWELPMT